MKIDLGNKQYRTFIKYAITTCDTFSLVFEKNTDKKYIFQELYNTMEKLKINKKNIWCHPDTGTTFENSDIVYYKCNKFANDILQTAYNILDWNGITFPEELCFYRNNKKWFACICHEKFLFIYNETKEDIDFLEKEQIKFYIE